MSDKSFKTLKEQLEILKSRGLTIENETDAIDFLLCNNYYRVSGYSMTIIRNLCAHGSRLFNRLFEQKPRLNKKERQLLNKTEDGTLDDAHLYSYLLVMKRLLSPENFHEMKEEIIALTKKYPFVHMRYYGFRDDWKNVL